MDIGSKQGFPSGTLSNFSPHPFMLDGVQCASMEGWLQSLKFDKPHIQVEVCKLIGLAAKRRGQKRNKAWKRVQKVWWLGQEFDRHSQEYQQLLDRAYEALAKNSGFRNALLATGSAVLTHSLGKSKPADTILTEREFCSRLMKLRAKIQAKQ